jgi:hypothetical protein
VVSLFATSAYRQHDGPMAFDSLLFLLLRPTSLVVSDTLAINPGAVDQERSTRVLARDNSGTITRNMFSKRESKLPLFVSLHWREVWGLQAIHA